LQSSLRNALATFGPTSPQYLGIKYMTDEQAAKIALRDMSLASPRGEEGSREGEGDGDGGEGKVDAVMGG
ncbi:hypothetical protein CC80DRAFT_413975, partial [Byssothecium circinans]